MIDLYHAQFRVREADLSRHLSNDRGGKEPEHDDIVERMAAEAAADAARAARKPVEFGSDEDYQLKQALNHLKGLPVMVAKGPGDESEQKASTSKSE